MVHSKEVFIKLEQVKEVAHLLESIKMGQDKIRNLFSVIDDLKSKEEIILNNWIETIDDVNDKIESIVL